MECHDMLAAGIAPCCPSCSLPGMANMRRDMAFFRNALLLLACIALFLAVAVIVARALG